MRRITKHWKEILVLGVVATLIIAGFWYKSPEAREKDEAFQVLCQEYAKDYGKDPAACLK